MNVIELNGVSKSYRQGGFFNAKKTVEVLSNIHLAIEPGSCVGLLGRSGSGKSTLFNMIGGLDKPSTGKVFIDEVDIAQLDAYELAWLRCRKIGYIFQTFNLIPVLNAIENVEFPLLLMKKQPKNEIRERAEKLIEEVGLGSYKSHRPAELSGGQRQRVAIARALVTNPDIVLADENGNWKLIEAQWTQAMVDDFFKSSATN